jgi:hypothetical protein
LSALGLSGSSGELIAVLREELNRKEALALSWRDDGANVHIRYRAALSTPWVQFHVQSTQAGEGGATYDTTNFTESTEIDCRASRVQDDTLPSLTDDDYYVWLIPVQKDSAGTVKYDGEGGLPDFKVFAHIRPESASAADLAAHTSDTANPHEVTAAQLGFDVIFVEDEEGYLASEEA